MYNTSLLIWGKTIQSTERHPVRQLACCLTDILYCINSSMGKSRFTAAASTLGITKVQCWIWKGHHFPSTSTFLFLVKYRVYDAFSQNCFVILTIPKVSITSCSGLLLHFWSYSLRWPLLPDCVRLGANLGRGKQFSFMVTDVFAQSLYRIQWKKSPLWILAECAALGSST